jgi:uncharacterized protein (DUF1501 family)
MDIWHTASDGNKTEGSGWIGRYLDTQESSPEICLGIDEQPLLALQGSKKSGLVFKNPKEWYEATRQPIFTALNELDHDHHHETVSYLYRTMSESQSSAEFIYEKSGTSGTATFGQTAISRDLSIVSSLIKSGISTRVYYVSHGNFDTHVGQRAGQDRLLSELAEGLNGFSTEMKVAGKWNKVRVLVFSEFGRRVKENASRGTDHGTANNVMILGGELKQAGVLNEAPNLSDLEDGDLKFKIDFRSIYASLFDNWLGADSRLILGQSFPDIGAI